MVSGIMDDFTRIICKGVMKAARRRGVNLVIFPAKYVDRDVSDNLDLRYEYQYARSCLTPERRIWTLSWRPQAVLAVSAPRSVCWS